MAGRHELNAFRKNRARQNSRGGGAVPGNIGSLARDFLDHLRSHILELVFQLNFFRYGDTVLGNIGSPEGFVEYDVSPFGTECHGHCVSQNVDASQNRVARVPVKFHHFCCHRVSSWISLKTIYRSIMPRISSSRMIRCSSPSILISVPEYLPKRIRSLTLTSRGVILPSSPCFPLPTATILPSWGFSFAVSGIIIPPLLFSSSFTRLTITRSCKGLIFTALPFRSRRSEEHT